MKPETRNQIVAWFVAAAVLTLVCMALAGCASIPGNNAVLIRYQSAPGDPLAPTAKLRLQKP